MIVITNPFHSLIDDQYYLVGPGGMAWPDIADVLNRRILGGPFPTTDAADAWREEHKEIFANTSSWWETGAKLKFIAQWTIDRQTGEIVTHPRPAIESEIVTSRRSASEKEIVTTEAGDRLCLCGCGGAVVGNAKRKFASDACKMRYSRARRASFR